MPKYNYGILSHEEVNLMTEEARKLHNGLQKSLIIQLAYLTGLRKREVLNLKWGNIQSENDKYYIFLIDKGRKRIIDLPEELYNDMLRFKNQNENIFNISIQSINRMMKELCNKIGITEERNIVYHSLRKAGVIRKQMYS